jgi:hypothetical protein
MNCYRCHATCIYKASGKFWPDIGGQSRKCKSVVWEEASCYWRNTGEGGKVDQGESGGMLPTKVCISEASEEHFLCSLGRFFITVVKFLHQRLKILQCTLIIFFKILAPPPGHDTFPHSRPPSDDPVIMNIKWSRWSSLNEIVRILAYLNIAHYVN